MTEAFFWSAIAIALFIGAAWRLRRGFHEVSSWPCLMFCFAFSGNVLAVPLALLGYEPFRWMLDVEDLDVYERIVVLAMSSYWAGYMVVRRGVLRWGWLRRIPLVPISQGRGAVVVYALSFGGAFLSIFLSAIGLNGYFTAPDVNYSPPWWLDFARLLIAMQSALLFFVILHQLQTRRRITFSGFALTAIWVLAGLASGYKTLVVMPALIVVVCTWISGYVKVRHVASVIALVWVAYIVVEPLRGLRISASQDNPLRGLQELASSNLSDSEDDLLEQFLRRSDYGGTALIVLAASNQGQLIQFKSRLDQAYVLFPIMAVVPRFLWPEKPLSDLGRELSIEMFQVEASSITPSQPVASFIWAGYFGVMLNNIILGIAATICGVIILRGKHDPIRYLPVLLCAISLSSSDAVMANYYINAMRYVLVTLVFYAVLQSYKRNHHRRDMLVPMSNR